MFRFLKKKSKRMPPRQQSPDPVSIPEQQEQYKVERNASVQEPMVRPKDIIPPEDKNGRNDRSDAPCRSMTVHVIIGHEKYWVRPTDAESFTLEHVLSDYSTADFMNLVIDQFKNKGSCLQLSEKIMRFFFEKDKPNLLESGKETGGDPWNDVTIDHYFDPRTQNTWTYQFSHGSGYHGFTGSTYYYKLGTYSFKSNHRMDTWDSQTQLLP